MATESRQHLFQPYSTVPEELYFYFPAPGKFGMFPAHVWKRDKLLACGSPTWIEVVERRVEEEGASLAKEPKSFTDACQEGTVEAVAAWMEDPARPVHPAELEAAARRCGPGQEELWARLVAGAQRRGLYSVALWSLSLLHRSAPAIEEFLLQSHPDFVQSVAVPGTSTVILESSLLHGARKEGPT
ncbi:hypothetical protein CYMTET_6087, partial [Cymbomonas tetramitiformis]